MFWGVAFSVPIYRNTYWDYLGRRSAWRDYLFAGTEVEKQALAESRRADWGFHPRYQAKYPFSIKTEKYASQTREETFNDLPRLHTRSSKYGQERTLEPKKVRDIIMVMTEHNRQPGEFDYNFPQYFYSTFPEIETESYVTVGGTGSRRVHTNFDDTVPE